MTDALIENYLYFTHCIIALRIRLNLILAFTPRSPEVDAWIERGAPARLEKRIQHLEKVRKNL